MKVNEEIIFPYYSGNIYLSKCIGHVNLKDFINSHRKPSLDMKILFGAIKTATTPLVKRELKQQLFSFTPSVLIGLNEQRKYENIKYWTGLMQLDFDKLDNKDDAIDLKFTIFRKYKHIVCAYLSPSRLGVKALMRIQVPKSKEHYKAIHRAVAYEMEQYSYFDNATSNAMLPLFLSYDENILYREYGKCFEWSDVDWKQTKYVNLNEAPPNFTPSDDGDYDYKRTIRICEDRINSINNDGHPQIRDACLILGSRVGAGYITKIEATNLVHNLVCRNSYLAKGTNGYLNTANWAINQGINNPKYYK